MNFRDVTLGPVGPAVVNEEVEFVVGQIERNRRALGWSLAWVRAHDQPMGADRQVQDEIGPQVFHHVDTSPLREIVERWPIDTEEPHS